MRTSGSALPFPSWTVLFVTLLFLLTQPIAAQEFCAAIAVRDVTPAPLLPVSGGVGPSSPTTQQQGNLNVRALVLESSETRVAIVSADFLGFPAVLGNRVRARIASIPPTHILIGATHTHHC
jgi:hypothetical protein